MKVKNNQYKNNHQYDNNDSRQTSGEGGYRDINGGEDNDYRDTRRSADQKIDELGEWLQNMIQDAVDTMDFSGLGQNIHNAVNYAQEEMEKQVSIQKEKLARKEQQQNMYRRRERPVQKPVMERQPGNPLKNLPGRWSGPVCSVTGGTGLAVFGALSLGFGLAGGLEISTGIISTTAVVLASVFFPLTVLSGILFAKGRITGKRTRRIKEYARLWKKRSYMMLDDLAAKTGYSMKVIRKDIRFILDRRVIPQARLDENQTCLMLTEEAGEQYDAAVQAKLEREKQERQSEKPASVSPSEKELTEEEKRMLALQKEAGGCLQEIRSRKERIQTPEAKEKIERLELLLSRIFLCVKEYPENISQTDRLMEYYLPSVMKLIRVYEDMEKQPIQSVNIVKTRMEITESLAMVNQALETIYNDLFQNVALDISSDIQVLETMLAKDGWGGQTLHSEHEGTSIWQ